MRPSTEWNTLPKFLIADDGANRFFVIHCHPPRFIMEFDDAGEGVPLSMDDSKEPAAPASARLLQEARDFFAAQIERQ